MTKTAQSLTTQLRDVAQTFCAEVEREVLNAARVTVNFDLKKAEKVYYPLPLRIAPTLDPNPFDPSFTSTVRKLDATLTSVIYSEKEKDQQP